MDNFQLLDSLLLFGQQTLLFSQVILLKIAINHNSYTNKMTHFHTLDDALKLLRVLNLGL